MKTQEGKGRALQGRVEPWERRAVMVAVALLVVSGIASLVGGLPEPLFPVWVAAIVTSLLLIAAVGFRVQRRHGRSIIRSTIGSLWSAFTNFMTLP